MKVLHLVFGISSCVMLIATLWLLAKDHNREYKQYMKDFDQKQAWQKRSQIAEFETVKFSKLEERLQTAVDQAASAVPDALIVDRFAAQLLYGQLVKNGSVDEAIKKSFAALSSLDLDTLGEHTSQVESVLAKLQELVPSNLASGRILEEAQQLRELLQTKSTDDESTLANIRAGREELFALMRGQISRVKFVEDTAAGNRKSRSAQLDEAKSMLDLAVRDGKSADVLHELEGNVEKIRNGVDEASKTKSVAAITLKLDKANLQRTTLESILAQLTDAELVARKNVADHSAQRDGLIDSLPQAAAKVLNLPILDAFGGPLKPLQIWLPNLTIPAGSFGEVARFDRCISCHLGIDKTAPGTSDQPAFPASQRLTVFLDAPDEIPQATKDTEGNEVRPDMQSIYGMRLAETGWANPTDVSVEVVWPGEAGARSGLKPGDALTEVKVGGRVEKIVSRADVLRFLVQEVRPGQTIELTVQRGLPQPFASHPRLDLYLSSLSPHRTEEMGCTICHEGQGSATEFKWVSHTPNTPKQAHEWAGKHSYFNNHHWIFPMRPSRFVESSCLKCHHEVEQLAASERFPEEPAPKLTEGYELVSSFGCYGCHEINGYDGPDRRIGPDLRNEPPYFAAAAQMAFKVGLREALLEAKLKSATDDDAKAAFAQSLQTLAEVKMLSQTVAHHPEDDAARDRLYFLIQQDAERATAAKELLADPALTGEMRAIAALLKKAPAEVPIADRQSLVEFLREDQAAAEPMLRPDATQIADLLSNPPALSNSSHKVGKLLKTVDMPGTRRRPGPSLRHVASKLDGDTLYRWILDPRSIRPTTKMPRFFGHNHEYEYLTDSSAAVSDRLESMEAYTAASYLLNKSQPFEYLPVQEGVTESPDFERGRTMFRTKGCLACHQHSEDSADSETLLGTSTQGPNLSDLGKKLRADQGKKWLHSWLLGPYHYNLRTRMPNVMLEPEALLDAEGKPQDRDGKVAKYDPAADITAYLLGEDWKPQATDLKPLNAKQREHLNELVYEYLKSSFPEARAKRYLDAGIPQKVAAKLVGHEVELSIEPFDAAKQTQVEREAELLQKKLIYVGRRTIGKLGCVGCHDVPGLESSKPIGTTLADWGRKESSKLAFEHLAEYLAGQQSEFGKSHAHGDHEDGHGDEDGDGHEDAAHAGHEHLDPATWDADGRDAGYFIEAMHHHQREGFLWQKLREPRSPDYHKTDTKGYNDRLRMPLFNWDKDPETKQLTEKGRRQIESVMTFVLGLVAEPPAQQYVYQGDARQQAIVEGERVLARFNCAGCHLMTADSWSIDFDPEKHAFEPTPSAPGYPFLTPFFTPQQIQDSLRTDTMGRQHAKLRGMLRLDASGKPDISVYLEEDEEFVPLSELEEGDYAADAPRGYPVELWEPAVIAGNVFEVKTPLPTISSEIISSYHRGRGGDFARYLIPVALKMQNSDGGAEAWAWGPPPLIDQGNKTQAEWLHDFLLDPHRIRPAAILRMPKFNLSSDEASKLVHYFAARDNADYPHQFNYRTRDDHLASREAKYAEQLAAAGASGTRFDDAFEIVVNKEGCVKCHLVGDFDPGGTPRAKGPNLVDVGNRLQADYLRRWLAKPDAVLPYTKMPVNFPFGPAGFIMVDAESGEKQQLYHGDSTQQIDGVVDLLKNMDSYLKKQISIKKKVGTTVPAEN